MAVTPFTDIKAIKAILDTDPYLGKLGFMPDNIFEANISDEEITEDTLGIYIYSSFPDGAVKGFTSRQVYTIDVIGNKKKKGSVMHAIEQIVALLLNKEIGNNHVLQLRYPPMQMSSPAETMVYETAFVVETTVFNPIKTI